MSLTLDEVRRIATLARLELTPEEEVRFVPQLARIVARIDELAGYQSTAPVGSPEAGLEARDAPGPTLARQLFLANAPESMDAFLLVPRVKGNPDA